MKSRPRSKSAPETVADSRRNAAGAPIPIDRDSLDRRGWWNWFLIAGTSIVITLGLATALLPLMRGEAASPWPWVRTDLALLMGLSTAMFALIVYLTQQQRRVTSLRRELLRLQDQAIERMHHNNGRLMALLKVSQTMGTETNPQVVFDAITHSCLEIFDCHQVSLMILEPEPKELVVRSAAGHADPESVLGSRQKVGGGIAGWVAERGGSLILGPEVVDPSKYLGVARQKQALTASMVVPIFVRGQLVGVLNVGTRSQGAKYDTEDLRALEVFAENAGTSIRHAEQAAWMRRRIETLTTVR